MATAVGEGYFSYEKIRPIAMAFCSVMLLIWIPITIANSYTIHNSGMMSNSQLCNFMNTFIQLHFETINLNTTNFIFFQKQIRF